jgi:hypothetical protein
MAGSDDTGTVFGLIIRTVKLRLSDETDVTRSFRVTLNPSLSRVLFCDNKSVKMKITQRSVNSFLNPILYDFK